MIATKATKSSGSTTAPAREFKLGKPRTAILTVLAKSKTPLTRGQIGEKTEITSGWCGLLGHVEEDKREEGSLLLLGFIKMVPSGDEAGPVSYVITEKGKKALAAAK